MKNICVESDCSILKAVDLLCKRTTNRCIQLVRQGGKAFDITSNPFAGEQSGLGIRVSNPFIIKLA